MKFPNIIFLLNISLTLGSINVLKVLDYISDAIDFNILNANYWNFDLLWTLNLIQIQSERVLDKYVSSKIDFETAYVPILRRLYHQTSVFSQKIYKNILPLDYAKQKPYIMHLNDKFKNESFFTHKLTKKILLWNETQTDYTLSNYETCFRISFKALMDCDAKLIFKESIVNCYNLITSPITKINNNPDKLLHIIYIKLKYIIYAHKAGCLPQLEKNGKSMQQFLAELCSNSIVMIKNYRIDDDLSFIYDIETMCLFEGYMDFLSRARFEQLVNHRISRYDSAFYAIHKIPVPLEMQGCFVSSQKPIDILDKMRRNNFHSVSYKPYLHPLAFDFDSYENVALDSMNAGMRPPELDLNKQRSGMKNLNDREFAAQETYEDEICDPTFTNVALRFLTMYMAYLLDPGPDALSAYRLDPDTYESVNISVEGLMDITKSLPYEKPFGDSIAYTNIELPTIKRDLPVDSISGLVKSIPDTGETYNLLRIEKKMAIFLMALVFLFILYNCGNVSRTMGFVVKRIIYKFKFFKIPPVSLGVVTYLTSLLKSVRHRYNYSTSKKYRSERFHY